jgi:hypothetical protein
MWEEGEIISHGSNSNSYKVRKIGRARKGLTTFDIHDLKPRMPTPEDLEHPLLQATRFAPTPEPMSKDEDEWAEE